MSGLRKHRNVEATDNLGTPTLPEVQRCGLENTAYSVAKTGYNVGDG